VHVCGQLFRKEDESVFSVLALHPILRLYINIKDVNSLCNWSRVETEKLIKIAVNSALPRVVARVRDAIWQWARRERDVGSSGSSRATVKDPFVYFHAAQYLTYNISMMPRAGRWRARRQAGGGVRCVFCLRVFFCRVYVQLRAENAAGSCKCTTHNVPQ